MQVSTGFIYYVESSKRGEREKEREKKSRKGQVYALWIWYECVKGECIRCGEISGRRNFWIQRYNGVYIKKVGKKKERLRRRKQKRV